LEYLNISLQDLKRNLWRLQEEGYLKSSTVPGNSVATLRLIEEMESAEGKLAVPKERVLQMPNSSKVFLVHGHDEAMESQVARFLEKLKLTPVILHEQANQGKTIIEKFERHSSDVGFAVVLLSPDDTGSAKGGTPSPRARQNVVLELGYFIGKLGRDRVCALHAGEVELPSDLHGVVWVPYSGDWKLKLIQELKAADIAINTDQL
jgi:predicted nucleotide-binding protein